MVVKNAETTRNAEPMTARSRAIGDIAITEIWNWGWAEHARVTNQGNRPQDVTGWRLGALATGRVFSFPDGYILKPGQTVTIHSGVNATLKQNPPTDLFWDSAPIWANRGDTAFLFDAAGNEVARYIYRMHDEPDLEAMPPQRLVADDTGWHFVNEGIEKSP